MLRYLLILLLLCLTACREENTTHRWWKRGNYEQEWIATSAAPNLPLFPAPPATKPLPKYAWENHLEGSLMPITKEHFRCKGCSLNPVRIVEKGEQNERIYDCGGTERHSLPIRDGKEFIYPILLDLLNHLQIKTQHRVVVTSGHRCPDHNTYVDSSIANRYSKHQIGAEVSFYVESYENHPEAIVQIIHDYYNRLSNELSNFERYTKADANVSTPPWMNKEIYMKLFKSNEGRNIDNRHPFPYISIQVRNDLKSNERVIYSWEKSYHNYFRY